MGNIFNKFLSQIGLYYCVGKGNHPQNIKNSIQPRPMPAELLNEVFAALPLENASGILAKMPNGLLARNVRKMLKRIKDALLNNKWNEADCGPKLSISEGGHKVKHIGPNKEWSTMRAQTPFVLLNLKRKRKCITGYYEVEIVKFTNSGIRIGFCDKQLPLNDFQPRAENTISMGILRNEAIILVEESKTCFWTPSVGNFSEEETIIGMGLLYSPEDPLLKCFITHNGENIGMIDLPLHFVNVVLFPVVSLYHSGGSIKANFGKKSWRFDPTQLFKGIKE